ncbi:MAG: hypothetical protein DLM56_13600 [Pseudonocardiales bacterium]|nr:MAG: hypothetical protein DLM56_13600 [Pseudonocardiales bacterium]
MGGLDEAAQDRRASSAVRISANLDGDRSTPLALFDRARLLAGLLDLIGAATLPSELMGDPP